MREAIDGFEYRVYPDGVRVLIIDSNQLEQCIDLLRRGQVNAIEINAALGYTGRDLTFLEQCPSINRLQIVSGVSDISAVHALRHLRYLSVSDPKSSVLDFSCFGELEVFRGDWGKRYRGLEETTSLKELALWKYSPSGNNLTMLHQLTQLENLELVQGSVSSLRGIEAFSQLRSLEASYMRQLSDISALSDSTKKLVRLRFANCPKLAGLEIVSELTQLKELGFSRCPPVDSLEFVKPLVNLRHISFVDTNVRDGDMTPLLDLPCLEHAGFMNKRHFSHRSEELKEALRVKRTNKNSQTTES